MSQPTYGAGPDQPGPTSLNKPQATPPHAAQAGDPAPQQPAYGQAPGQQQHGQQQHGGPPPAGYGAPQGELSPAEQRQWGMLAHLGGIVLGFLAGLIVYLLYKDRGGFVKDQATEALNFQITACIAMVATVIVSSILSFFTFGLSSVLPFVLWIGLVVLAIIAGLAANKGQQYRYPFSLRLIK